MTASIRNGCVVGLRSFVYLVFRFSFCRKKEKDEDGRFALGQAKKKKLIYLQIFTNFYFESSTRANCRCGIFFAIKKKLGSQFFNKLIQHIKFAKNLSSKKQNIFDTKTLSINRVDLA